MAQAEDWFGLPGVAWLQGLLHLALAVTLWVIARRHAGPLAAALILILGLFAASPGLSMRPQVISYLLVAVTTAAWMSSRADGRARWWLVPLTWVWAMCHGMWPVGIVIGLVAVVGHRPRPGPPPTRPAQARGGAGGLRGRGRPHAGGPGPVSRRAAGRLARAVLRRVATTRLHQAGQRRPAPAARTRSSPGCCAGVRPSSWTEILLVGLALAWAVYTTRTTEVAAMMLVPLTASVMGE